VALLAATLGSDPRMGRKEKPYAFLIYQPLILAIPFNAKDVKK
jgi:hypothetical protein